MGKDAATISFTAYVKGFLANAQKKKLLHGKASNTCTLLKKINICI